ncbi:MAG: hypothetical protein ACOCYU_01680 [Brevefilum sp.]
MGIEDQAIKTSNRTTLYLESDQANKAIIAEQTDGLSFVIHQ